MKSKAITPHNQNTGFVAGAQSLLLTHSKAILQKAILEAPETFNGDRFGAVF